MQAAFGVGDGARVPPAVGPPRRGPRFRHGGSPRGAGLPRPAGPVAGCAARPRSRRCSVH
eukprot:6087315-Lingulodinium_polyedra.AAC.1